MFVFIYLQLVRNEKGPQNGKQTKHRVIASVIQNVIKNGVQLVNKPISSMLEKHLTS